LRSISSPIVWRISDDVLNRLLLDESQEGVCLKISRSTVTVRRKGEGIDRRRVIVVIVFAPGEDPLIPLPLMTTDVK
jgi:hypothetical protein